MNLRRIVRYLVFSPMLAMTWIVSDLSPWTQCLWVPVCVVYGAGIDDAVEMIIDSAKWVSRRVGKVET